MTGKVLAIIPARGGSRRLPGKNLMPLHGQPMIAWTIRAALEATFVDRVILSSDDEAIMAAAANLGCEVPFRRPDHLATDDATTIDVILHALKAAVKSEASPPDMVIILQPTSPLRLPEDIDGAVQRCRERRAASCISVTDLPKPKSFYARRTPSDALKTGGVFMTGDGSEPVLINGAVYAVETEHLLRTGTLYGDSTVTWSMPFERSVDIDTSGDFALAEALWRFSWGRQATA